jgi:hypothetical protein
MMSIARFGWGKAHIQIIQIKAKVAVALSRGGRKSGEPASLCQTNPPL